MLLDVPRESALPCASIRGLGQAGPEHTSSRASREAGGQQAGGPLVPHMGGRLAGSGFEIGGRSRLVPTFIPLQDFLTFFFSFPDKQTNLCAL